LQSGHSDSDCNNQYNDIAEIRHTTASQEMQDCNDQKCNFIDEGLRDNFTAETTVVYTGRAGGEDVRWLGRLC